MTQRRRLQRRWLFLLLVAPLLLALWWWSELERQHERHGGESSDTDAGGATVGPVDGATDGGAPRASTGIDASVPSTGPSARPIALTAPRVTRGDPDADAGALEGVVVARASGHPVPGAELVFAHAGATHAVVADDEGRFVLAPDSPGTYELAVVAADGFLPFAPEWGHSPIRFEARPGVRIERVRVVLVDAVEYVVQVVDADDAPVSAARVRVFGVDRGERALAPMRGTWTTDGSGEIAIAAPDGAVIEASHPDHGAGRARLDSAAQVSHRVRVVLSDDVPAGLAGDRSIRGRVIDPDGAPVEGAVIVARHLALPGSEEADLHPSLEATSDADGSFALDHVDSGSYRLVASADGFARLVRQPVSAGADDVVLRLSPEGRVLVRALDAETGAPVAALTVVAERPEGPIAFETLAVESGYDAEGELEIGGLPEGPLRVVVSSPGYASSDPVEARAVLEAPRPTEVRLPRGGTVRGRVVSLDGAPLSGARATLEDRLGSGSSAVPLHVSALTDADGRFELRGVSAGTRSVVVWAADHHGRVRSGITVRPGEAVDLGAIDLSPVEEGERPQLELAGIGAVLSAEGDALIIRRVVEGGGAAEAGLGPGDAILEIGGEGVVGLGFGGSIERIRGPEGTTVRLRVRRAGAEQIETVDVPRRRIRA